MGAPPLLSKITSKIRLGMCFAKGAQNGAQTSNKKTSRKNMKTKALVLLVLFAIPLMLSADVIYVPMDYPSVEAAIDASDSGDTLVIDPMVMGVKYDAGDILIIAALEPKDAPRDSGTYGPGDWYPPTPVE